MLQPQHTGLGALHGQPKQLNSVNGCEGGAYMKVGEFQGEGRGGRARFEAWGRPTQKGGFPAGGEFP